MSRISLLGGVLAALVARGDDLNVEAHQASVSAASHGCRRANRSSDTAQAPAKYAGRNDNALSGEPVDCGQRGEAAGAVASVDDVYLSDDSSYSLLLKEHA
jgi:hypothetical protein